MSTTPEVSTDTALELRLRRMWKEDIESAYRGRVNDVLSHVENRVRELLAERVRQVGQDFRANIEHAVASIVIKILAEYQVKGGDGKPICYGLDSKDGQ